MLNIQFYFSFGSEIFVFLKIVIRLKPTLCLNIFPRHCLPLLSDLFIFYILLKCHLYTIVLYGGEVCVFTRQEGTKMF